MTQVTRKVSLDSDFEDLLESFEKKFAKKLAQREPPKGYAEPATSETEKTTLSSTRFHASDYENELSMLLVEIQRNIISKKNNGSDGTTDDMGSEDRMDASICREVMRAEIRTSIEYVQQLHEQTPAGSGNMSPSQRSTAASMKRRLREKSEEIEMLRKQKKIDDLLLRNMGDAHATDEAKIKMLQGKLALLETEEGEHDAKIQEYEVASASLTADKRRLEKNVAILRTELLNSHHKVSEQKLRTSQADRRVADLETRAAELRSSENTLTERVKELHDVQGQMLLEMKKVIDSKDAPAARRALANLNSQRSRIVGRIAAIMTKRNAGSAGEDDVDVEMQNGHGLDLQRASHSQHSDGLRDKSVPNKTGESTTTDGYSGSLPSMDAGRQDSGDGAFARKSSLLQIFRGQGAASPSRGNERTSFVPSAVSKSERQQIYESNLVRSREVPERDSDVLREVVEQKATEIDRLEDELKAAKAAAATLERELHSERQNRRKENRNLHIAAEDEPLKHIGQVMKERSKPQTLFDWHVSSPGSGSSDDFFPQSDKAQL